MSDDTSDDIEDLIKAACRKSKAAYAAFEEAYERGDAFDASREKVLARMLAAVCPQDCGAQWDAEIERIISKARRRSVAASVAWDGSRSQARSDTREQTLALMLDAVLEEPRATFGTSVELGANLASAIATGDSRADVPSEEPLAPSDAERYSALVREAELAASCGHVDTVEACLRVASFIKLNGT